MKIGFNSRFLYDPAIRGWNRYSANLLRELNALGVDLVLYADRPIHESYLKPLSPGKFTVRVAPAMRYFFWEQCWLPRQCALDKVDLLHAPANFGLPWLKPCPRVLTLHDAIDKAYTEPYSGRAREISVDSFKARWYLWTARACADTIITVSEHARSDLIKHVKIPKNRIAQ